MRRQSGLAASARLSFVLLPLLCACRDDRALETSTAAAKAAVVGQFRGARSLVFEDVRAFASPGIGGRSDYAFCGQVSANGAPSASFYSAGSAVVLEDADPIGYARVAETYCVGAPRAVRF